MCGILGYKMLGEVVPEALDFFEQLFVQSQIRGKHASGCSFILGVPNKCSDTDPERDCPCGGQRGKPDCMFPESETQRKLYTYKMSSPARTLVETDRWKKIKWSLPSEMIAHTRYSTSGAPSENTNNQPVSSPDMAVVHNGLVSMASQEEFEQAYHVKTATANDTEIILRYVEQAYEDTFANAIAKSFDRLHEINPPIFSCGFIDYQGTVTVVRDHIRPLWLFYIKQWEMVGFCSTRDIFTRACAKAKVGMDNVAIWEASPYTVYTLGKDIQRSAVSLGFSYPTSHRFERPNLVEVAKLGNDPRFTKLDNPEHGQGDHRKNLRESFKRYSAASIASWEIDPNYPMMNYLFRRFELSKSQEFWACFLYGVFYHPGTVFYVMQEFPEFEKVDLGRLKRWHMANWKSLRYNKDRKYEKGHFVEMFESYLQVIGKQTPTAQEEFFNDLLTNDPIESFRRVTKALLKLVRFGRYSVYIYTECLARCMGLPIVADTMFLKEANSPRAGLCYVVNKPDWAKAKLTAEEWETLEIEAMALMFEIRKEYPSVGVDQWFMESCLCAYKGFFHNGRYLGYYIHRMADEILQMQHTDITSGVDWNVLWQFRKEQLPWEYLGEYQKPPILKVKNDWRHTLAETGYMIGMWPMARRGIIPTTPVEAL